MVTLKKSAAGALITTQKKVNHTLQKLTAEGFAVSKDGEWELPKEVSHDLRHQIKDAYGQILWLQEKVGVASGFKADCRDIKEQLREIEAFQRQIGTAIARAIEEAS